MTTFGIKAEDSNSPFVGIPSHSWFLLATEPPHAFPFFDRHDAGFTGWAIDPSSAPPHRDPPAPRTKPNIRPAKPRNLAASAWAHTANPWPQTASPWPHSASPWPRAASPSPLTASPWAHTVSPWPRVASPRAHTASANFTRSTPAFTGSAHGFPGQTRVHEAHLRVHAASPRVSHVRKRTHRPSPKAQTSQNQGFQRHARISAPTAPPPRQGELAGLSHKCDAARRHHRLGPECS